MMKYEHFLFTRSQRRDFTAFVRPAGMTNKEVSLIASAFNHINDITPLTAEFPALYLFLVGEYAYLVRFYNSGRTHSGREIAVIEGIAVRREVRSALAAALPHFIARQAELLNIVGAFPDLEALDPTPSALLEWQDDDADADSPADDEPPDEDSTRILNDYARLFRENRLIVPFTPVGRLTMLAAVRDTRFPYLYFAFGTNREVLQTFAEHDVAFDIAGLHDVARPEIRPRDITRRIPVQLLMEEAAKAAQAAQHSAPTVVKSRASFEIPPPPAESVIPKPGGSTADAQADTPPTTPERRSILARLIRYLLGQR